MNNPIITRELIGLLRTRRALVLQVALVGALSLLIVLRWPSEGMVDLSGVQSLEVLRVFGYGLTVILMLLAPVFPATSIVKEKRAGTLALLLNSPLKPWEIMFGKLVGILGFVILLLVLSLTTAAACFTMGGVDLYGQLLKLYMVLFVLALSYASVGLVVSAYTDDTDTALKYTYGLVLSLGILSMLPYRFLQGQMTDINMMHALDWLRTLSPIPALQDILGQSALGAEGLRGMGYVTERFIVLNLLITAGCLGATTYRLSTRMLDRPRDAGKMTDDRSKKEQAFRRFFYLWFFDPQRRSGLIGPFTNPVMVKEFRCRRFGRLHWMMRAMGASLVTSLFFTYIASTQTMTWSVQTVSFVLVTLQFAIIILLTPALSSGLISNERDGGGWVLMQMTPLSPVRIVWGKLLSVFITLGLILLATLPAVSVMYYIEAGDNSAIPTVLATIGLTAVFCVLASAAVGSFFKRNAEATTVAYAFIITLFVGTMLVWLGEGKPFSRTLVEVVLQFNPIAGVLALLKTPGFETYDLIKINLRFLGLGCVLSIIVLAFQVWRLRRPV
jgi:ABC-type transport system involved in multi-copper enzyme maturation permease subunit